MFNQVRTRLSEMTAGFTSGQKAMMSIAFVAIVGGLWFFSHWAANPEFTPLYTDLETSDAAAITSELDSMGVSYQLADQGRSVLVPRSKVYKARLDLSTAGLPQGGSQGYSLLDKQGITSTQFQQRVAYQRALEGELARTISDINSVSAASVHLVIPKDDLFTGDAIKSSASVLVKTASPLTPGQVDAVVNLVAGSVQGLSSEEVTVTDQTGTVLAAPGQSALDRSASGGAANKTHQFESALSAEIEQMLTAAVGPGHAVVTVSAEMNWDASSSVTEVYKPSVVAAGDPQLGSSESTVSESYSTRDGSAATGILGSPASSTSTTLGPTASSDYNRSEVTKAYVYDSEKTSVERAGGSITKLNVAVLLDDTSVTAAQATEIESLVTAAAGIDNTRGDTLAVSRLTFDTSLQDSLATEADAIALQASSAKSSAMMRTAVIGGLSFLVIMAAIIQLWRGRRHGDEEDLDLTELTRQLAAPLPVASTARTTASAASTTDGKNPAIAPSDDLKLLVDQQPEEVARLLRGWLADRRAVSR